MNRFFCLLVFFLLVPFSCVEKDPTLYGDDSNNENLSSEVDQKMIATEQVKEIVLRVPRANVGSNVLLLYQDFNYKYELCLYAGHLDLTPYIRNNGQYSSHYNGFPHSVAGIKSVGKCSSINDITSKPATGGSTENSVRWWSEVQPQYGYDLTFKTDDNIYLHVRVYVKSYTLMNGGALESITILYQLY